MPVATLDILKPDNVWMSQSSLLVVSKPFVSTLVSFQALVDSLEVLEKLITRHRLSTQTESNMVVSEWLAMRCEAMYLKIR